MKTQQEERMFTKGGLLIGVLLFSIYLWALLQLDPEWVMWIGFATVGTLPSELPPPLFADPRKASQVASVLTLLGLIVLLLLMVVAGDVRFGWLSWVKARLREWVSQEAR